MPTFADLYPCRGWPAEVTIWIIGVAALLATILLARPVAHLCKRLFSRRQPGPLARCAGGFTLLLVAALPQFGLVFLSRVFCLFAAETLPGLLRLVVALLPFLPFAGTSLWVYGLPEVNTRSVFRCADSSPSLVSLSQNSSLDS